MNQTANPVDQYISNFPKDVQQILQEVRSTIKELTPGAQEVIKYGIPTYVLNNTNLVHFGGFKKHVGFYPVPSSLEAFKQELSAYKGAKGSVQFPFDQPMPLKLIEKIVKFRINAVEEKSARKGQKKTCKNGHTYYKSSDCPTCPICEASSKPDDPAFSTLSAPARRALENNAITSLAELANRTEQEVLAFHGMGPASIPKLKKALNEAGLKFKNG